MSKKGRQRRGAAPSGRRKRKAKNSPSLVIPIVVGVVVVTVIVGAIISVEKRRAVASSVPGIGSGSAATAQSLSTQSMPNPEVPRISVQETREKMEQGEVLLVDVRSKASYDKTHAVGAVSIPEEEIDFRIGEIPRDQDVVLYCT